MLTEERVLSIVEDNKGSLPQIADEGVTYEFTEEGASLGEFSFASPDQAVRTRHGLSAAVNGRRKIEAHKKTVD